MDKNNQASNYSKLFVEENSKKTPLYNTIILVILFAFLASMFGYYLGAVDAFKPLRTAYYRFQNPTTLKDYSSAELQSKIDYTKYDFDLYQQIIGNLKDLYVDPDKVSDEKMFDQSVKGLVDGIGDPNTVYMNAEDYKKYKESFSGTFQGIGVRLEYSNGAIAVSDVFSESPADKSGVKAGYIFLEVDGKSVATDTIDALVEKVRGQNGSKVTIKFLDPLNNEEVTKEITRGDIKVESIRIIEKSSDTAVVEISRFTETSPEVWRAKWDSIVSQLQSKGYKNLVLDLRGNTGGYLDAAVYAASDFIDPGKVVVSEKTRSNGTKDLKAESGKQRLKNANVVILINGGTASASEILAGALKYHKGYKILGTKSYGKGTVQMTYPLDNGGALKVTTEYWLMPDGKRLDKENPIQPDTEIKQDAEKFRAGVDNILDEGLKLLK